MIILGGQLAVETEGISEQSTIGAYSSLKRSIAGRLISTQSQFVTLERAYTLVLSQAIALRMREYLATTFGPFDFVDHEGFSWLTQAGSDDSRHAYSTGAYFAPSTRLTEVPQQANGYSCDNTWKETVTFWINARGWRGNSVGGGGGVDMTTEVPSGTIDGVNNVFTLSQSPVTLLLFRNGLLQVDTVDYNLSGSTITFTTGNTPLSGDSLIAYYTT